MICLARKKEEALEPLNESIAQDVVYAWCARGQHDVTVPNCGSVYGPETDVASVTKARLGHAFEIKVSRSDWLSELRQIRGLKQCAKRERAQTLSDAKSKAERVEHLAEQGSNCCGLVPPSYFWLVTAPGVVQGDELPAYAGLMEIQAYRNGPVKAHGYTVCELKPAPRLHRVKLRDSQIMAMARGVTLRYWQHGRNT